jgi:hypothetical protein
LRLFNIFKLDAEWEINPKCILGVLRIKQGIDFVVLHIIAMEENMFDVSLDELTDFHVASDVVVAA